MVLVQDFCGLHEIQAFCILDAPGQLCHPLEIGARNRGFTAIGMHPLELLQLPLDLRHHFFGDDELGELIPECLDLLGQLGTFAELLLNGLELLAQVVLALPLVYLAFRLQCDFLLNLQQFDLPHQQLVHAFEAGQRFRDFQDLLQLLGLQIKVGRHQIRQSPGVLQVGCDDQNFLGHGLAQRHSLFEGLFHRAHERIGFHRGGHPFGLCHGFYTRLQQLLGLGEIFHAHALDSLHQSADASVGQFQHAHDERRSADTVEIIGARIVHLNLLLGEQ